MRTLKQSTATTLRFGPFVDDSDGKTAETGLTISQADIRLSKAGGDFAQTHDSSGATHDENGWYSLQLDATDTNTLGLLTVAIAESGALPVWEHFTVVPSNVYDSLVGNSDKLQVDATQVEGSDATDQINAACDTALTDYDAPTKAEMDAAFTEIKGATWASGTDTLEAIRDRGDAAWITATGFSTFDPTSDTILIADGGITAAKFGAGAIDAAALAADAGNEIADAVLTRGVSNVEDSADAHSLCTVVLACLESSLSGTTWTIKKTDGSTTFTTKTVTTDEEADPITAVT